MPDASADLSYIRERLGSKVLEILQPQGDEVLILERAGLRESFRLLKEDKQLDYDFLSDITAVDYWRKQETRFEVVYQILSRGRRRRVRVRVPVPENDPSVESL
jgi:NADH-quinone oxidoreductase subunit C